MRIAARAPLLGLAAALALSACNEAGDLRSPVPAPSHDRICDVRFETVALPDGAQGYLNSKFFVVDDAADWCRVWDELFADYPSVPCDESLVDFSREVAIIASIGTRGTGGYRVTVVCVNSGDIPGAIEIFVVESAPGSGCIVTQSLTSPITVAKVEGPVTSATFETAVRLYDCD